MVIQIQVSDDTWKELNNLKRRGETFEDVIQLLLKDETPKEDE